MPPTIVDAPPSVPSATAPPLLVNPGMLMTVGHYHGYPLLPLKPGVSIAEGNTAWRTFTSTAPADMLVLAAEAARATWSDDPMTNDLCHGAPDDPDDAEPCRDENDTCRDSKHQHFDLSCDGGSSEQADRPWGQHERHGHGPPRLPAVTDRPLIRPPDPQLGTDTG